MPDQDRVEEAGHGQQQVGQELLEAAQPEGLLPCSGRQGPWLTPGRKESGMSGEQAVTQESPAAHEAVGALLWLCSLQAPRWESSVRVLAKAGERE